MKVFFEKWHGCKNDFMVVWLTQNDTHVYDSLVRRAPQLCSRDGSGVGADGILVLQTESTRSYLPETLAIINKDGSIAANCGNGLRCAAASVLKKHLDEDCLIDLPEIIELNVKDTCFHAQFLSDDLENTELARLPYVSINMGVPSVGDQLTWYAEAKKQVSELSQKHNLNIQTTDVYACEVGNQHICIFNQDTSQRKFFNILGHNLQTVKAWDGGINVHLCEPIEVRSEDQSQASQDIHQTITDLYKALPWERGVGPTAACGSGAVSIAACAFEAGDASRSEWVGIDMPGGRLYARQDDHEAPIMLAGPAAYLFEGHLEF